jgi:hypothetical protein
MTVVVVFINSTDGFVQLDLLCVVFGVLFTYRRFLAGRSTLPCCAGIVRVFRIQEAFPCSPSSFRTRARARDGAYALCPI